MKDENKEKNDDEKRNWWEGKGMVCDNLRQEDREGEENKKKMSEKRCYEKKPWRGLKSGKGKLDEEIFEVPLKDEMLEISYVLDVMKNDGNSWDVDQEEEWRNWRVRWNAMLRCW